MKKTFWGRMYADLLLPGILCLILCGCGRLLPVTENEGKNSAYSVYYTDAEGITLIKSNYDPKSESFDGILMELLDRFQNPTAADMISVLPSSVKMNGYTMGVDNLTVDFNAAYLGLTNVQEVLLRSGVVKTLVQLPGVQYVSVTVDGQPIKEPDGTLIGQMNDDTFIDSQGNGINSLRYLDIDLYFANEDGQTIAKEKRSGTFSSNISVERVIVEEVIHGPQTDSLLAVVNPDVKINEVKTVDDICTVNFDSSFNDNYNSSISPEAILYSFVNALCESTNAKGVLFQIEGSSDVRFLGQISLDQIFERNADILSDRIKNSEQDVTSEEQTASQEKSTENTNDDQNAEKVLIGVDASHAEG